MAPTPTEKYSDVLFNHQRAGERERLALMAESLDPASKERLRSLQPKPNGRFLDLGSGLGTIAEWLAAAYADAEVVATDLTTDFMGGPAQPNLRLLRHDLATDEFEDGSFDLIHTRWVLCHLRTREQVLARIVSWLAPGGLLVVEEPASFPLQSSPHDGYRKLIIGSEAVARERLGFDGSWGRRFPDQLRNAGLVDCGSGAEWPVLQGGTPWARFWLTTCDLVVDQVIASGAISRSEAAQGIAALTDPTFTDLGPATVAGWGRAPG